MITSQVVTVAATATLLSVGTDTDGKAGRSVAVRNTGVASIFLGGPTVTDTTGWELEAGAEISFDLNRLDVLYGITDSGTVNVMVLQVGV